MDRTIPAPPPANNRSRIGNGVDMLPGVDNRSPVMRRYRELVGQFVDDMGGDPSEAKLIVAKRAATLTIWCEEREADMANGDGLDVAAYTTSVNALHRLLGTLGFERRPRNVTPTLATYLEAQAAKA